MPITAMSAGMRSPVAVSTATTRAPLPDDPADRRAEPDVAPPAAVEREEVARDFRRDHPAHQPVGGFEHGHGLAEKPRRAGDLEADEAAADHHHVARACRRVAELPRVARFAEREHAVEPDPVDRRHARPRARREREAVEWQRLAALQRDRSLLADRSRPPRSPSMRVTWFFS